MLVRYGQLLAALGTTRCQHAASVLRGHALAEAMLVHATAIVRLKCSFHLAIFFVYLLMFNAKKWGKSTFRAAKLHKSFELRKKYLKFSSTFYVFFGKMRTFAPETR